MDKSILLLSKNGETNSKVLSIKSNKPIKIRTSDGQKFSFVHYTMIGDSVIATSTDTIALKEITSLKGTVKGNVLRKIGGGLVACTGYYFVIVGYLVGTIALYPPAYLLILPSAGVAYAGHYLSGARRFDTTEKWSLSVSTKAE
jgi:hypothetical protein